MGGGGLIGNVRAHNIGSLISDYLHFPLLLDPTFHPSHIGFYF